MNNQEISCIQKLIDNGYLTTIIDFLIQDKIIDRQTASQYKVSPDIAKKVWLLLERAKLDEKIQLISYNWTILPIYQISITIVSNYRSYDIKYE